MAAQTRQLTCINCPMGCLLTVTVEDGAVTNVAGNTCRRGATYAQQEAVNPQRIVTSLVNVKGCVMPVSCKTSGPVSKALIGNCLLALRAVELTAPVHIGDVVVSDICGTGVDVVATKDVL